MARSPFLRRITSSTPYTVPASKYLVCAAHFGSTNSTVVTVLANGLTAATIMTPENTAKPLVFDAGTVISVPENQTYSLSGFLYDAT